MKRRLIIFSIIFTSLLFAIGGGASLLVTAPNLTELEPNAQIQQDQTGKAPIAIAGGSWGGIVDGEDDDEKDPPPQDGDGGGTQEGGSWGG